ncbi:MAG: hypothetical protein ABI760_24495 [Ferruginibacter sp.]
MIIFSKINKISITAIVISIIFFCYDSRCNAQGKNGIPNFKVIAFYTCRNDRAHISFVHEANKWYPGIARQWLVN